MSPAEWAPDPNQAEESWPEGALVSFEIVLLTALVLIVLAFLIVVAVKAAGRAA